MNKRKHCAEFVNWIFLIQLIICCLFRHQPNTSFDSTVCRWFQYFLTYRLQFIKVGNPFRFLPVTRFHKETFLVLLCLSSKLIRLLSHYLNVASTFMQTTLFCIVLQIFPNVLLRTYNSLIRLFKRWDNIRLRDIDLCIWLDEYTMIHTFESIFENHSIAEYTEAWIYTNRSNFPLKWMRGHFLRGHNLQTFWEIYLKICLFFITLSIYSPLEIHMPFTIVYDMTKFAGLLWNRRITIWIVYI